MRILIAGFSILLAASLPAMAAPPPSAGARGAEAVSPQPVLSNDGSWIGVVLIGSLGLFVAAAIIGPIVRREFPDEVPPAHAHDEPPGSSHRHGPGGTFAPEPR